MCPCNKYEVRMEENISPYQTREAQSCLVKTIRPEKPLSRTQPRSGNSNKPNRFNEGLNLVY